MTIKNSNVKNLFITLSNINTNMTELRFLGLEFILKTKVGELKDTFYLVVVKERHERGDYHYHIYLQLEHGLSKHTYKNTVREWFPCFRGITIDVQGVKSKTQTLKYIFKNMPPIEMLKYSKGTPCEMFHSNNFHLLNKIFIRDKVFRQHSTMVKIIDYETYQEWAVRSIAARELVVKSASKARIIWEMSRNLKPMKLIIRPIINNIDRMKVEQGAAEVLLKAKALNMTLPHAEMFNNVVAGLIFREGLILPTKKYYNIIVCGPPNTGKSSLITRLTEIFNRREIFYFVGGRPNDFYGFRPNIKPLLVWDDVFKMYRITEDDNNTRKTSLVKWSKETILKVLGHEPTILDVKYRHPVMVPPSYNLVITNEEKLFEDIRNISARCLTNTITQKEGCQWENISDEIIWDLIRLFILVNLWNKDNCKGYHLDCYRGVETYLNRYEKDKV